MKHLLLFGLVLILTACGTPDVSTPAPSPEAIKINYPQALHPWVDKLASCASNVPQIALYFLESDTSNSEIQPNTIELELGPPNSIKDATHLFQVGSEQIVVIANNENPISQLSNEELRSIFSGPDSQSLISSGLSIQVWVLPEGEPTRNIFDKVALQDLTLTSNAMLAPDPYAMLQAVSKNTNAIGYLPGSLLATSATSLTGNVKIIHLDPALNAALLQPVVAITQSEPNSLLRNLLVCLETNSP